MSVLIIRHPDPAARQASGEVGAGGASLFQRNGLKPF